MHGFRARGQCWLGFTRGSGKTRERPDLRASTILAEPGFDLVNVARDVPPVEVGGADHAS